jgi:predicted DNA-binding helix-hairpin-helix protein
MTQDQDQIALLSEVESFCRRHGLADSKFGALTPINDTHLVERMRSGMLRRSTMNRVRQFMARYELDHAA